MSITLRRLKKCAKRRGAPLYYELQGRLPLKLRRYVVHFARHRKPLHLKNPETFSEKMSWRMIYDRRDLMKVTCDKKAMKELARKRAGDLVRVPKTIWSGTDLSELAQLDLPEHWVLKPNHRSGMVHFGHGPADIDELSRKTTGWLEEDHWQKMGEWAYSAAEQVFLLEELIGEPGETLWDYKFDVFDGVVRAAVIHIGRFADHRRYIFYSDFTPVAAQFEGDLLRPDDVIEKPENWDRMIEASERIAAGFDHMRVDLYSVGDEIWFGETTPYQGNGVRKFRPTDWDLELGSFWTLPQT